MKKNKKNVTVKEVREFIADNPKMTGGNVKLMTGNVSFGLERELAKLRKETNKYKLDYKILKTKV